MIPNNKSIDESMLDSRSFFAVRIKRSHGDIYVYLELCKQKRRADDVLEFSRVPYSDPKQKRAFARDGN